MAKFDLRTVGPSKNKVYKTEANATAMYAGEPIKLYGTYSSGAASTNYAVECNDAEPVIGTDSFAGIASKNGTHTSSADGEISVARPIPNFTEIWGKAKTTGDVDTDSELLAILGDVVLFDLTSSTYTIDDTAAADTSGLRIEDGNPAKGELGVIVDARAMRNDVS